jgi:hypothetical protein
MGPVSVVSKTETEITLTWSSLSGTATGNSDITQYTLYFDDNTGETTIKLHAGLLTEFNHQGTTGGLTYKFAVRAENIYGEGPSSDELSQIASDVPDIIKIATTSISGTEVVFAWEAPFENYQPILEYDIIFLAKDGTYV